MAILPRGCMIATKKNTRIRNIHNICGCMQYTSVTANLPSKRLQTQTKYTPFILHIIIFTVNVDTYRRGDLRIAICGHRRCPLRLGIYVYGKCYKLKRTSLFLGNIPVRIHR